MAEGSASVVYSRQALAERLAAWPGGVDTSWALVFFGSVPSAAELAACKEAARLCDRVAGVRFQGSGVQVARKEGEANLAEVVRAAGCDLLWVVREVKGHVRVDCGVDGVDGTLLAQAAFTVLPLLVVAPRGDLPLVRALRNLQGLGETFTLRVV